MPHLNLMLQQLGYDKLTDNQQALIIVYNFMSKHKEFKSFMNQVLNKTVTLGTKFATTVINETVKILKENKEIASQLSTLTIKAILREIAIKKLCTRAFIRVSLTILGWVTSTGSEPVFNVRFNLVMLIIDAVQCGLEFFDFTEYGKYIGLIGNIAIGLIAGAINAGVLGVSIGASGGFLIWVIGEAVGQGIEQTLQ